jgi:hypothetical protein
MYRFMMGRKAGIASAVALALLGAGLAGRPALATQVESLQSPDSGSERGGGWSVPAPPAGVGFTESAPVADETTVPAFVDHASTNQRGIACDSTLEGNAGVRVVSGFLQIWQPSTLLVDA